MTAATVETLAAQLTERHGFWEIWYTAEATWCIRLTRGAESEAINKPTVLEAFEAAVAFNFVPIVRPRPRPVDMFVRKNPDASASSRWELVDREHSTVMGSYHTRTKAEQVKEIAGARISREIQNWDEQWGALVTSGTEGVDYRVRL